MRGLDPEERAEDLRKAIKATEFRGLVWLLSPRLAVEVRESETWVTIDIDVPDRTNVRWTTVHAETKVAIYSRYTHQVIEDVIRKLVMSIFTHEVDEGLWFEGRPVVDPHKAFEGNYMINMARMMTQQLDDEFLSNLPKFPVVKR